MAYIITIFWLFAFVLVLWKAPVFSKFNIKRTTLLFLFALHVSAGVMLSLIYTFYYPQRNLADTFKYYDDAKPLYNILSSHPIDFIRIIIGYKSDNIHFKPIFSEMNNWYMINNKYLYNDNRTLIRINAVLMVFSFGHYYVHVLFFAFLSLVGKLFIYKTFEHLFISYKPLLFSAVFLVPSIVFWSSGVMKEGPLFFILGILLFSFERWSNNYKSTKHLIAMAICFLCLFFVKFYVAITLFPALITLFWLKQKDFRKPLQKALIVHICFIAAAITFHFTVPQHSFICGLKWQKSNFYGLAKIMNSGSVIHTQNLENDLWSFLLNIPEGLFNALFRPFLWDAFSPSFSPLILASALENLLFFTTIFLSFKWFRRPDNKKYSYMLFCFSFAILLYTLSGVVTPIIGTLVRYKIPAMSMLFVSLMLLWDEEKLSSSKWIKWLNNKI